ncbi:unnamed protein product, partial [Prorocentrum cordatum]
RAEPAEEARGEPGRRDAARRGPGRRLRPPRQARSHEHTVCRPRFGGRRARQPSDRRGEVFEYGRGAAGPQRLAARRSEARSFPPAGAPPPWPIPAARLGGAVWVLPRVRAVRCGCAVVEPFLAARLRGAQEQQAAAEVAAEAREAAGGLRKRAKKPKKAAVPTRDALEARKRTAKHAKATAAAVMLVIAGVISAGWVWLMQ